MGTEHAVALGLDGTVYAWGRNASGQIGTGNVQDAHTPVAIAAASPASAVGAGRNNSVVVKRDGSVWAWGAGGWGALGTGSPNSSPSPVQVPGLSGFRAVDLGDDHVLALKSDGTVWAWGFNLTNEVGAGAGHPRMTPFQVPGISNAIAVAAGSFHSLALRADGTVVGWGQNFNGELGNGSQSNAPTPVTVNLPPGVQVVALAAGAWHSLFLAHDGSIWATGDNGFGELGVGSSPSWSLIPLQVPGVQDGRAVGCGTFHSLAARGDGQLWSWGRRSRRGVRARSGRWCTGRRRCGHRRHGDEPGPCRGPRPFQPARAELRQGAGRKERYQAVPVPERGRRTPPGDPGSTW